MGELQEVSLKKAESRVLYFDFLRIVAMIAVITLHTAASNWGSIDIHSFSWRTFNFFDAIVRWGVPVFTMISGALFLGNARELKIKTLYFKNVLRLVVAFLFWSVAYATALFIFGDRSIRTFVAHVIQGHYHMWFLFMIVGLYIITPLLRKITADKKATQYFLILSLIFTFVIPAILLGIKIVDKYVGANGDLLNFANSVYGNVNYHFTLGYSTYFVLGYYLHTTEISKKVEKAIYILGILGFAATIILTKYISYYLGSPNGTFYGNMTINVLLESVAVFTLAKCRISKIIQGGRTEKIIKRLSKYSFGIYLVHAGFISVLGKLGLTTLSFNPILAVIVIVAIVFALSYCVSAVLNRIPYINKYIV